MLQRAVRSQRWLVRQQSSLTLPELGVFEFLVLCFEQVAVAGAAINCFQARESNGADSENAPLFLPAVARVIPQAVMVIVVLIFCIVWGSQVVQWVLRAMRCSKCVDRVKTVAKRRYLPPVLALLKLFFLLYVTLRLNDSSGLQWKQQTSALCAALILVVCEVVDVFAVAHSWVLSRCRGVPIQDWREQEGGQVDAKQLVLTFFDRWKDCGLVTSFLSQSEITLLVAEIPSMAWASWTCCQRGATPEHVSYQLHRWLTVLTIVMGMNVILVAPQVENDIVGASIFLVADVALTALRLFEGRHRRRARREAVRTQRQTMITAAVDNEASADEGDGENGDHSVGEAEDDVEVNTIASSRGQSESHAPVLPDPQRAENVLKQLWELKRSGGWRATIWRGNPGKEWAFASLDCLYSVLVVVNFYETVDGSERQIMPGLLTAADVNSLQSEEDQLMREVSRVAMVVSSAFWTILGLSLAARHYFLYSSRRQRIPGVPHYFPMDESAITTRKPNYFALSVEAVKVALLPVSICGCAYVLVPVDLYVLKQGVNVFVAGAIGAIAAARCVDACSRALYGLGRFDGDPPGMNLFGGSLYVKASTALQVFWDRFNDFLGPLSLDHLVVSSEIASQNFTVVYFLLCVCVLHALIAYVDAINIKSAVYRAERLGYLIAVTFLVRNSAKYVERQGPDLFAPVLLVAIEFFAQVSALVSRGKVWCSKRKAESAERASRRMPMLSSISEPDVLALQLPLSSPDEWPVLSSDESGSCRANTSETHVVYRRLNSV
ncbi:hypothetical protein PF005_g6789 [Phytophthora fragariae]|uniref:Uncharacterized protein n=1 Tax=Phytophthora fragariae TaxID=53985 RepID=A0A6A3YRF2_9STRA|nr:hypothetical protein PF003_g28104 [Phytophthora fragariae]KAE8942897.1 hypothetical protein PF009_g7364 [Phytophthora fragariae]KAE9124596.1 hypothetical protein PF007_g6649 [Phytophthora fragariae]KAE9130675.1 hypothetical protein PF010_g3768 [Phytophthora fragariae]KAE9146314.1 hypothetical protein PF006_g8913 [Phytophthora fragariae]